MMTSRCHFDVEREQKRLHCVVDQLFETTNDAPSVQLAFERVVTEIARRFELIARPQTSPKTRPSLEKSFDQLLKQSDLDLAVSVFSLFLAEDSFVSPEARIKLQGQRMFSSLLNEAGGTYKQSEVAELLNLSVDGVRKRQQDGRLLSVMRGDHRVYPVWQFGEGAVLPHFEEILKLIDTSSDVGKIRFFLTDDPDLGGTPIDAIRKGEQIELIKRKARQFGKQDGG